MFDRLLSGEMFVRTRIEQAGVSESKQGAACHAMGPQPSDVSRGTRDGEMSPEPEVCLWSLPGAYQPQRCPQHGNAVRGHGRRPGNALHGQQSGDT
ncbi:unnamed protein product [Arctogadus glacialis]